MDKIRFPTVMQPCSTSSFNSANIQFGSRSFFRQASARQPITHCSILIIDNDLAHERLLFGKFGLANLLGSSGTTIPFRGGNEDKRGMREKGWLEFAANIVAVCLNECVLCLAVGPATAAVCVIGQDRFCLA